MGMDERHIGWIEHYYPRVHAAVVRLDKGNVHVGDRIHIVGHGTDLVEEVTSLQVANKPVREGHRGESVGLWVARRRAPKSGGAAGARGIPRRPVAVTRSRESAWAP